MTYSKNVIANMALGHCCIGTSIDDVDNEISNEAIQCRRFYDHVVKLLHGVCEWDFALVEVPLVIVDYVQTNQQWAYVYKYPVDCELAVRIQNPAVRTPGEDQQIPFKVKNFAGGYGKVILCDLEDAVLEYNTLVADENLWNANFAQADALGLAAHIGGPLRVDPRIMQGVNGNFSGWLAEAVNKKQREQTDDSEPQSDYVTVR